MEVPGTEVFCKVEKSHKGNTVKLYHFRNPQNFVFAQAGSRGTWFPTGVKICPECNSSRQKRVSPLILEWEPGSDVVGDFAYLSGDEVVVTQKVKDALEKRFREVKFGAVKFWQEKKLHRPQKITRRSKPRIWLPYDGPTLWNVIPTKWCHLDYEKSKVSILKECATCGKTIYVHPSWPERHLVIDTTTWNGEDIFHVYEYSGGIFCTQRAKEYVEMAGFTNVAFLEDGEIFDEKKIKRRTKFG